MTRIVVIVLAVWLHGARSQAALSPVNLRCELRVNPLGIGTATPRLSWQLQSTGAYRGEVQTAYQILAGSAPGTSNLWDSGNVANVQTADIMYAGQPLTNGQRCFWQVRVSDGSNVSAWSAPAQFSMGLLAQTNWTAQ